MEEGGSVLDKYRISYADLTIGIVLGEGSFGTVHKGELVEGSGASRHSITGTGMIAHAEASTLIVAIKTVRTTKVTRSTVSAFMREVKISKFCCYLEVLYYSYILLPECLTPCRSQWPRFST